MFIVTVRFDIDAKSADLFLPAVIEQAKNSLQLEEHCHTFDVCVSTENSASFYLYEKYTDTNAFDLHLQSEHFKTFDATVSPWTVEKSVATWTEIEGTQ